MSKAVGQAFYKMEFDVRGQGHLATCVLESLRDRGELKTVVVSG